jgi:hypothetical protein
MKGVDAAGAAGGALDDDVTVEDESDDADEDMVRDRESATPFLPASR